MCGPTVISLLLLALLGTGLTAFTGESFGDSDEKTGELTAETDIIKVTNQPDILEAMENQTINCFAGDDTDRGRWRRCRSERRPGRRQFIFHPR